jgi:uncharacterized protein (DUF1015 family)
MPRVAAFRGLHYALDRFGAAEVPARVRLPDEEAVPGARVADLSDVACPPYDVIAPSAAGELLARHERNAIRLELNPGPDPHAAAGEALAAWRADGTLERRKEPTLYGYSHTGGGSPDEPTVRGVLTRVLLEGWGAGVRPHEHTMPGPKADRLALLRATRTQLSPILAVYFDRSGEPIELTSSASADEWRARDVDGLLHRLVALEDRDDLVSHLGRQTLFVADGHHRYETALAYREEVRSQPGMADAGPGELAADWMMIVLVNAARERLEILPTHRVVLDADPAALRSLVADPRFEAIPMAAPDIPDALEARRDAPEPTFGLALPGDEGFLLVGDLDAIGDRMRREPVSPAVQRLELAVLHAAVLSDRLGIDAAAVAAGNRLLYTRDAADALARVREADASAAILVRPTRLEQLATVANVGDVMPQKSTYFHPKLLTGLVFNPLED